MVLFKSMKTLLEEKKLGDGFSKVYLPAQYDEQYERFLDVLSDFGEYFDKNEEREVSLFSAPGRSEVCGNHTDHNGGRVISCAISLDSLAFFLPDPHSFTEPAAEGDGPDARGVLLPA